MKKKFKFIYVIFLTYLFTTTYTFASTEKIKIGLLVPMTGKNEYLGQQIIKSARMALEDIDADHIEIYPKDTNSDPNQTLKAAKELKEMNIKIIIGPIFYNNLSYLEEVTDVTFISLTNKTLDIPANVISGGVNTTSQLNSIKKFIKLNEIKETIFLTPKLDYEMEIKKGIKNSKIEIRKHYVYDTEPTKLTKQIEKITNYNVRKQNLLDEILRIEKSDLPDKEKRIERLKKKYTIGKLKFDSIIIADFDESLKSVITSLLYTDVLPKEKFFITFNQWFDESLLKEVNTQPIYFPSINKKNLDEFQRKFLKKYKEKPNHLSLLSYDLVGLVYYLSLNSEISEFAKLFKKKNSFKGKIGIFDIQNNKINHRLNFYQVENGQLKEIF